MSLRLRLTLLNTLILLLVGGALVAAVYAILVQGLQRQIDDSLREQARLYSDDVSAWFYRESRRLPGPVPPRGGPREPDEAASRAAGHPGQPGQPGSPGQQGVPPRAGPGDPAAAQDQPGPAPSPGQAQRPSIVVGGGGGGGGGPFGPPSSAKPGGPGLQGPGGGPPQGPPGFPPPDVTASLGPPELVVPILRRFAGTSTFVQVANVQGYVEARSENLGVDTLPLPPDALDAALTGSEWIGEAEVEGQRLRVFVMPLQVIRQAGEPPLMLVLQVAQPLGAFDYTLRTLRTTVLLVGAAGALVALAAGWMLARTALHPIDRLAQTADAIGAARDFGRRVPVADARQDEIGRLAMAFNRMLGELQQAHDQVATALVAQRRFVADASHELRTPLATLRGNIDLLRQILADLGNPDATETIILDDVSGEAERMSRLVADLLLLAQADAGQHLTLRPLDLTAVAREAARTARLLRDDVLVEAANFPDGPDGLTVLGHADRLRQVLLILLDNAVKHTPANGRVRLTAERLAAAPAIGGAIAAIRVSDDGPGIPEAEHEHIFERFYRAPGTRSGEGAGLGLAIARWIVEEHHGTITVESTPGAGATFTVQLPALPSVPEPPATPAAPEPALAPVAP